MVDNSKILELSVSFFSGIVLTIAGAWFAYLFQKTQDSKKEEQKIKSDIYRLLLDIYSSYFWITSSEVNPSEISLETKQRLKQDSWKVADKLRELDSFKYQEETLSILFSENYSSATERYDALESLISKLDGEINPNYIKTIREISKENLIKLATTSEQKTAPANLGI